MGNKKQNKMNNQMNQSDEREFRESLDVISKSLKKYKNILPEDKKPTILVCGKTGNGKTTTINTLFGEEVGKIGHFRRGTTKKEIYEWESDGENIKIIDLPGLGDAPNKNKEFREIYRRCVAEADGFIVVVAPPRPAEDGTLETVRLLISCGVSSKHIIFGYNKFQTLNYDSPTNGKEMQVELDGLIGPTNESHKWAIEQAKRALFEDLQESMPRVKFVESQIIEYDAKSGWNLHQMLNSVIEILPFHTFAKLKKATDQAQKQARAREAAKLKKEREELQKELEKIKIERESAEKKKKEEKEKIEQEKQKIEEEKLKIEKEQEFKEKQRQIEDVRKKIEEERRKIEEQAVRKAEELERKEIEAEFKAQEKALAEERKIMEEERSKIKELESRIDARIKAIEKFDEESEKLEKSFFGKFISGVSDVIAVVDTEAAEALRDAGKRIEKAATTIYEGAKKVVNTVGEGAKKVGGWLKKGWNSLFG